MATQKITEGAVRGDLFRIPLDQIVVPPNPVREFDPPEDVFEHFYQRFKAEGGQKVPGIVKVSPDKQVILVDGQQRYRAAKRLQEETGVPQLFIAVVFRGNEEEAFDVSVTANEDRIAPSPVDDAKIARTYIDKFGKSMAEVATKFGKSEAWVSERLKLLDLNKKERLLVHTNFLKAEGAQMLAKMTPEKREETLVVAAQIETQKSGKVVEIPSADELIEKVKSAPESKPAAKKKTAGSISTTSLAQAAAQTGALGDRAPEMKMKEFKEFIQEMVDTEVEGSPKIELGRAILGVITRKFGAQGFDNRVEPLLGMKDKPKGKK